MNSIYDKNNAEAYLGATALALQEALESAVIKLAKVKGTTDLAWFDELHQEALKATSGLIIDEVSVKTDDGARRFASEVLDAKFKSLRISFVEKRD